MKDFYLVIKAKVMAGQYTMEEIIEELQLAYEKNYIDLLQLEELKVLAETSCDPNYSGNKYATAYDLDQDVKMSLTEASVLELFEIVMGTIAVQTSTQREKISSTFNAMARSSIGDLYLKHVLEGRRLFSEVHPTKQEEVAEKLIAMMRCDLIDVEGFHPPHSGCLHGNDLKPVPLPEPVEQA